MQITVYAFNDQLVTVQVDGSMTVETLKAIVEAETQIPAAQQALVWSNRILADSDTMDSAGIKDGDVLQMAPAPAPGAPGPGAARRGGAPRQAEAGPSDSRLAMAPDGAAVSPAGFAAAMKENTLLISQLQQSAPELYKAIMDEDLARMQEVLRAIHKQRAQHSEAEAKAKAEEEELYRRVAADPFDIEAQRRIEEIIQQKNIEENFMSAMEHNPEVFAQVSMLYVDMEVNGVHVKAFIDSGAQMTIMTSSFVEQCFLGRLVDKRFKGMALGVGSSTIVGRVHQAPIKVAGHFLTCSISVLDQKGGPQFIFGLDMLRRHQACIDLKKGVLAIGSINVEVPFLPDSEIPRDINEQISNVSEEEAAKSMAEAKHTPGAGGSAPSGTLAESSGAAAAGAGASRQPAAAPVPAAAPAQPASQSTPSEAVQQLMALGYSQQEVEQALQVTNGNVEAAASLLTFGG